MSAATPSHASEDAFPILSLAGSSSAAQALAGVHEENLKEHVLQI